MSLFDIEPNYFADRSRFNRYLAENYDSLSNDNLYIVVGLTEYDEETIYELLERNGYQITEEFGAIDRISCEYGADRPAEFYFSFDDDHEVLLFYTDMRKTEEIENTVEKFLERTSGIHYLYIGPQLLQEIREDIVQRSPAAEITEFVAKRTERTDTPATTRPEYARTINYYGRDGLETLRELEATYGVLPRIMEFDVPGGLRFRVNREGVFKRIEGSLLQLFEHIQQCIQDSIEVKEEYENSNFEMLRTSSNLEIPISEPALIDLENSLEYREIPKIKDNFEDHDYVTVGPFADEGSLYFSAKIVDQVKNTAFRVKANESQIKVFPIKEEDFGAFYRFYEFVQDSLDENATLSVA